MDHAHEAELLIARLAEALEEPNLRLDENGACTVAIEDFLFSFFYHPEPPALYVQAGLGTVEQDGLERLLRRNHLWGGTGGGIFGLNPEDQRVYLTYRLDFPLPEGAYPELLCDLLPQLLGALSAASDTGPEPTAGRSPAPGAGEPAIRA